MAGGDNSGGIEGGVGRGGAAVMTQSVDGGSVARKGVDGTHLGMRRPSIQMSTSKHSRMLYKRKI